MDTNGTAGILIPGWTITLEGVSWIATRDEPLTSQQERYGCRTRVQATTPQELRLLCSAEDVHAGFVSAAERLLAAMVEHGRQWRDRTEAADVPEPREVVTRLPRPDDPPAVRPGSGEALDMPPARDEWRTRRAP